MSTLRNLDLNLLKIFDAIHRSGSVSGAARQLGMSQPSVSRGLSRLRDHFDDPLFERSGNGVVPTAKGSAMLDSVQGALSLIGSTIDEGDRFDPATQPRHFRLLIPDFIEATVGPALVNSLPPGSPVTFEIVAFGAVDLGEALAEGTVDVGVMPFLPQAPDLAYRTLFSDRAALMARKGHPALTGGFSLDLFAKASFVALPAYLYRMSRMDELLRARGLERRVVYTTHKIGAIPQIVAETDLVAFAPGTLARFAQSMFEIDVFPMPEFEGSRQDVHLAYRKSAETDPGLVWLCDRIEAAYDGDGAAARADSPA